MPVTATCSNKERPVQGDTEYTRSYRRYVWNAPVDVVWIIDNSGSIDALAPQIDAAWTWIQSLRAA